MKSFAFITALLFVCIAAIRYVRAEVLQVCVSDMNVEQAQRNLLMAVCNQMKAGFINNLDASHIHMKRHNHDDDDCEEEEDKGGREEEVSRSAQFPPFPPFPPYPAFPPYPPFPPFPPRA